MTHKSIIVLIISFLALNFTWGQNLPQTIMKYVSVDPPTGDVDIHWNKNSDVDVDGYYIYRYDESLQAYLFIKDVPGRNSIFIDNLAESPATSTSSLAATKSETYSVVAYDVNVEGPHPDHVQSTIYLSSTFRPCYAEIKLGWTPYTDWPTGVLNYKIYRKIDLGVWNLLDVVDYDINSYNVHFLEPDRDYYFYVEAIGVEFKSTSNQVTEFTDMPHSPIVFNANYASVSGENHIDLSFQIDTTADVIEYVLLRSDSLDGDFDTVSVFTPASDKEVITYTDYAPTNIIHYYKLIAINTCGVPYVKTTNYASNIVLEAQALDNLRNFISWTNYFDWQGGISHYNVYRKVDYFEPVLIMQLAYGDTIHLDRLDEFLYNPLADPTNPYIQIENPSDYLEQPVISGNICYYVTAYEFPFDDGDTTYTSKSNEICVTQMPRVFVPNAFTPNSDGLNDLFFPFLSFAGTNQFEMRIYNRWGNLVYRTIHVHQGWNGTQYDGTTKAPIGTYIYQFSFNDGDGKKHEHTGQVTLIR
ncbi:MAG: gliding motility-associated C-terminal domain-containing protein [Bacteroidota bacterium]|nr:gliding motility-associated C-terminal domain-containing protein [Bacteroidota bacterium]